ncbi:hypothetical protein I4F81_011817 [Pyropia yezoensis]|uniref:Uncharacterized protein n=1 Tax=Pyropia yezoensis TaxID=2788 RepID=A0ACC3CGK3_PYRYE|nr:hypothetical protein I4F81_011817 [Neopyropia yezoensis]
MLLLRSGCGRVASAVADAADAAGGGDYTTASSAAALRAAFAPLSPALPTASGGGGAGGSTPPASPLLTHLVMVAGHAVFVGATWTPEAVADEANWVLEP